MTEIPIQQPEDSEALERRTVERIISWGNKALRGEFSGNLDEYEEAGEMVVVPDSEGDFDVGDTVVLDLNDARVSEKERQTLLDWLGTHLESPIEEAAVGKKLFSPDETTQVTIYKREFGTPDNPWYISQWQNEGENPSFVIWSRGMYEQQEELGYTEIEEEK